MNEASLQRGAAWEAGLGDPIRPDAVVGFGTALANDESERFPVDQLACLHGMGLFAELVPREWGGQLDEPERVLLLSRILSRRDLALAVVFGQSLLGSLPIWLSGSAKQRQRQADLLLSGRLACLALTERSHGSDLLSTSFGAEEVDAGSALELTGEKWLINNGSRADVLIVLARGYAIKGGRSDLVLLQLERPARPSDGWHDHPKVATLGIRAADISGFRMDRYRCESAAMLPSRESAIVVLLKTLQVSRILCAGFSLGATDTMLRLALGFARDRLLYGKRVTQIPVARAKLAACLARLLAADVLAQATTRAITLLPGELAILSPIAKYQVPLECEGIVNELAIVLGARSYLRAEGHWGVFQKARRDLQVVSLFDGSTQVNLALLAGQLRLLVAALRTEAPGSTTRPDESIAVVARLLLPDQAVAGWPVGDALRVSAGGSDSLMLAYRSIRRGPQARDHGKMDRYLGQLDQALEQWLDEAHRCLWIASTPLDDPAALALARRYVHLWQACACALGWALPRLRPGKDDSDRTGDGPFAIDDDLLVEAMRQCLPELGIPGCESRNQRLLDRALVGLDEGWMYSHTSFRTCGRFPSSSPARGSPA